MAAAAAAAGAELPAVVREYLRHDDLLRQLHQMYLERRKQIVANMRTLETDVRQFLAELPTQTLQAQGDGAALPSELRIEATRRGQGLSWSQQNVTAWAAAYGQSRLGMAPAQSVAFGQDFYHFCTDLATPQGPARTVVKRRIVKPRKRPRTTL